MVTRRRTIWARWRTSANSLAAVGTAKISLRTLIEVDRPGLGEYTITRTIGNVTWINEHATANVDVLAGLIVLPATVDVATAPDPFNEPHADWMYYRSGTIPSREEIPNVAVWEFDLASQRRQRELERDWAIMLNNRSAQALQFSVGGSSLLKLG